MGSKGKYLQVCWTFFLMAAGLTAANNDRRVVEAAKRGDKNELRTLLSQHADVNAPQADGATALAWAAHRDDLETADLLIRAGANPNAADDYGVTPLALACTNRNAAMAEKLLQAGANPNVALATGETPLMIAARTGSVDTVKSLLDHAADVNAKGTEQGQTALMWAVAERHAEVARTLIEHGADPNAHSRGGFTALLFAARNGDMDSARVLLAGGANVNEGSPKVSKSPSAKAGERNGDGAAAPEKTAPACNFNLDPNCGGLAEAKAAPAGMTPLLEAAANGHEELAIFFLEKGADPNAADSNGFTGLHFALLKGISSIGGVQPHLAVTSYMFRPDMVELVKALLARGANPNTRLTKAPRLNIHSNTPRFSIVGATPFLLAAGAADINLMRILRAAGADPMLATTDNTTPLMVASGLGRYVDFPPAEEKYALEAAKLTVELGADINAVDENGYTPLHGAAYVGANSIIQFLADKGANLDARDKFKQTPLSIAEGLVGEGIAEGIGDFSKKPFGPHPSAAKLLLQLGAAPLPAQATQRADEVPATRGQ